MSRSGGPVVLTAGEKFQLLAEVLVRRPEELTAEVDRVWSAWQAYTADARKPKKVASWKAKDVVPFLL